MEKVDDPVDFDFPHRTGGPILTRRGLDGFQF
jgi:hypothetical protein